MALYLLEAPHVDSFVLQCRWPVDMRAASLARLIPVASTVSTRCLLLPHMLSIDQAVHHKSGFVAHRPTTERHDVAEHLGHGQPPDCLLMI